MNLTLYRNTAERNSMRPALNQIGPVLVWQLRDSASLIDIEITIEKSPQSTFRANYIFIEELNRYYHVNNVTALRNGLTVLNCTLDPLYTYYEQVINCPGLIARCESVSSNRYLQDPGFVYPVYPGIIRKMFSDSPTDTTLVLMVTAGAEQVT